MLHEGSYRSSTKSTQSADVYSGSNLPCCLPSTASRLVLAARLTYLITYSVQWSSSFSCRTRHGTVRETVYKLLPPVVQISIFTLILNISETILDIDNPLVSCPPLLVAPGIPPTDLNPLQLMRRLRWTLHLVTMLNRPVSQT